MPDNASKSDQARRPLPTQADTAPAAEATVASGNGKPEYVRLGMTVFEEPDKALDTICALTDAGLEVDQVGLMALEPVLSRCASLSAKWSCFADGAAAMFRHIQYLCVLGDGEPLLSTSSVLFDPIRATIGPAAQDAGATRTREQRKEIERLLRSGAVALVARAADSRQQQTITRLLLANSQHRVTTYDVPKPAATR